MLVIDNFSKFGLTIPLKNKNPKSIKQTFESILSFFRKKTVLIETDRGKEFDNSNFQKYLNNNNIKHHSRDTCLGDVFAEKFNRTIGDSPENPVFEKGDCNWNDLLPVITIQY